MNVDDRTYRALRRAQILTGVVPVGLFLISHFAVNGRAIAGREAYAHTVAAIGRLPWLTAIEWVCIALPLLAHLALGVVLGLTRQGAYARPRPSARVRVAQRVTGFYLAMYVVIHVWAIRLAPERLAGKGELFDLMAAQLRDPIVFGLQALAVLAAGTHFALGLVAMPDCFGWSPAAPTRPWWSTRFVRASFVASAALVVLGLNALLAFVWTPAQWLAAR